MNTSLPRLVIFASGSATGGGSGFQKLVEASLARTLQANIVAVVSNHKDGGVRHKRDHLVDNRDAQIDFIHSPFPRTAIDYQGIVSSTRADFVVLSGWLGKVEGLDPRTTINIHPAWLPSRFGGKGMHGHHVHEAVIADYEKALVSHSGVTMHFVTPEYDSPEGMFFRKHVPILPGDTAETLAARVNAVEHRFQAHMTNLVVTGTIRWDGENSTSMEGAIIDTLAN
jgi:phosphoribosylglycinamide formyltransferase 1